MRFLYIAPRCHNNQMSILKGLVERGHEVCFISHYQGLTEDYSYVKPVVLGYSSLYRMIDFLYVKVIRRKDPNAVIFKIRYGFPSRHKLKRLILDFRPDVVILREKSVYSIMAYQICKKAGYPCILYNQSPLWSEPAKTDLMHRIADGMTPPVRITPVMGRQLPGTSRKANDFFVPFVAEPQTAPEERDYLPGGIFRILCIGKFEVRKNHLMLLSVVERLHEKYPLHLMMIGETANPFHEEQLARVKEYIKTHHMEDYAEIKTNLPRKDMDAEYAGADLFVIPSTGEPASVSQLEAMSFSLPVICSDKNGTACYVEDGVTGYLFRALDQAALLKKLDRMLSEKDRIPEMGAAGYRAVMEKYGFDRYYDSVMKILERIRKQQGE